MKIFVRAQPNAKSEKIEKTDPPSSRPCRDFGRAGETHFVVAVKEPPRDGRANEAIAKALAAHFNIARARIRLASGFSSRQKTFEIL